MIALITEPYTDCSAPVLCENIAAIVSWLISVIPFIQKKILFNNCKLWIISYVADVSMSTPTSNPMRCSNDSRDLFYYPVFKFCNCKFLRLFNKCWIFYLPLILRNGIKKLLHIQSKSKT